MPSIKFKKFIYIIGPAHDGKEEELDGIFRIYCEVKYPSRNVEESLHPKNKGAHRRIRVAFCAEDPLDGNRITYISKEVETTTWYGQGNYRYNIIYTEIIQ